ncbi:polysaccharide biosynthesis protein [Polynucleobacter bastaniensis]|uniref:polysaccharide biosynthesis protein n=1 Tax=Polynucleobacter bastaniensis TaxID=2081039 RepID=UPI001C0DAF73|nr:nucleoside-diphosphate sugar epimerase/dehydratase [Polynucleobacter bastaniensis]MBU3598285.1 polysaccharide biosynthesis protein [Polynucleobacter bastaniensis]
MLIYDAKQFLLNLPRSVKRGLVILFDLLICAFSVWLALGLRLDQWGQPQGKQWLLFFATISISCPLFIIFGLYRAIFRFIGTLAFLSIVRVFIIYTVLIFSIFTIIGVGDVPRSIGIIQPILLFIGIGSSRYFVRHWLGSINYVGQSLNRAQSAALIYGAGSAGRQLAAGLSTSKEILVKGFFDDDSNLQGSTVNGILVYPNIDVRNLIRRLGITEILLAIPSASQNRRNEIIGSLNGLGVRVRTLPGMLDMVSGRVRVTDLHDLDMNDLLGRKVVDPDVTLLEKNIRNKVVLVTGAGGSIGGELCRQIIKFSPKSLILIDISEHSLYQINEELQKVASLQVNDFEGGMAIGDAQPTLIKDVSIKLIPCMASVRDAGLMHKIFSAHQPDTVFHAAAYKHVPLVEKNPAEGIRNNVYGTLVCAQVSLECCVSQFILVSTDKAVRPTNIMGVSKRIAELVLQSMADNTTKERHMTNFSMVRFGNVLGSSGSVAPLFSAQIAAGGPITLTHPEVTRYFMTIPEAAQLVIQASAMAVGGDVFVLDMGEPVRIHDLAVKMIYLSGLLVKDKAHPHGDIEIAVTGLRPGEKLYEELLIGDNPQPTSHPKIMKAHEEFLPWNKLQQELDRLNFALDVSDGQLIVGIIKNLVPGYQPTSDTVDWNGGSKL